MNELASLKQLESIKQAVEDAVYRWRRYRSTATLIDQASELINLSNAMHDLTTWVDGYDFHTDSLPWERAEWD